MDLTHYLDSHLHTRLQRQSISSKRYQLGMGHCLWDVHRVHRLVRDMEADSPAVV